MHDVLEVFIEVLKRVEQAQIPYMVVGSVASAIYGEPRLTHDLDLVIDIQPNRATDLYKLFANSEFYCPPIDIIRCETKQRGQFNLIHQPSGYKIDIVIRKATDHGVEEFNRRKKVELWQDAAAFVASPEDVIIKKLQFYKEGSSEKHLRDIAGMMRNIKIDREYVDRWVSKLSLREEWMKADIEIKGVT